MDINGEKQKNEEILCIRSIWKKNILYVIEPFT